MTTVNTTGATISMAAWIPAPIVTKDGGLSSGSKRTFSFTFAVANIHASTTVVPVTHAVRWDHAKYIKNFRDGERHQAYIRHRRETDPMSAELNIGPWF